MTIINLNIWMSDDDIPYEYLILLFSKINLKHPKLDSKSDKFTK